jgi:MSHA pilin protein MshD
MCTDMRALARARLQAGLSLVELIIFIIIVSVGLAGILSVFNLTSQKSADPQIRRQMLAVAEALLEEVELKPLTYCDPDDPNAATATSSAGCTGGTGGANDESKLPLGPEIGETRPTFDNVSDYNGLNLSPASDINGTTIAGYSATVSVTQQQLEGSIPLADSLRITVTVTHGSDSLALSGYRLRYAPNSLP